MAPLSVLALVVLAAPASTPPGRDSDRDGIPDAVEDRNHDGRVDPGETDPGVRDSDRDGVPDGVEDRDHDGRVDPGESDPRVPGLFPGRAPHIPEPLAFDLVRGLGARKGEFEMNTLVLMPWTRPGDADWAPEIEWAPRDNFAVELELPIHGDQLKALKLALQFTFPRARARKFIAGWQLIGEYLPGERALATTSMFLAGYRLSRRWSVLGMVGARLDWSRRPFACGPSLLANPSVFVDLGERVTLGVEHNVDLGVDHVAARALPQLHVQLGRRWRLQLGAGVQVAARRVAGVGGLRLIFEL